MSTQAYPDTTVLDVIGDKFVYQQEHTDIHESECPEARRHNWWRTSLFTNEEDRISTGRYTCSECLERVTIGLDLPPEEMIHGVDDPESVIIEHDGYKSIQQDDTNIDNTRSDPGI